MVANGSTQHVWNNDGWYTQTADVHRGLRCAGAPTTSSRVQSHGGSNTPAPPARTRSITEFEASVGSEKEAEPTWSRWQAVKISCAVAFCTDWNLSNRRQARREGGKVGESFGGPYRRSKIQKMVFQMASFWPKLCIKSIFGRGSAPDPAGGAYDAPPNL